MADMKTKPRPLIVVDLLKAFILQQTRISGPFDTADTFYAAMQMFLRSAKGKEEIRRLWLTRDIDLRMKRVDSGKDKLIPAGKVFADIEKRLEEAISKRVQRDCVNIKDDAHAVKIILASIKGLHELGPTVDYDSFSAPGYHGARAAVERAIKVIADVVRVIDGKTAAKLNPQHVKRLQDLSLRLDDLGRPVPAKELWGAYTVALCGVEKALTGRDSRKEFTKWLKAKRAG